VKPAWRSLDSAAIRQMHGVSLVVQNPQEGTKEVA